MNLFSQHQKLSLSQESMEVNLKFFYLQRKGMPGFLDKREVETPNTATCRKRSVSPPAF